MRTWQQLAKDTLAAQDTVDLAALSKRLIDVIFDVHTNLVADGMPATFACIQQHPICKAWAQLIFKLTGASSGQFGYNNDLKTVELLAFPASPDPEHQS